LRWINLIPLAISARQLTGDWRGCLRRPERSTPLAIVEKTSDSSREAPPQPVQRHRHQRLEIRAARTTRRRGNGSECRDCNVGPTQAIEMQQHTLCVLHLRELFAVLASQCSIQNVVVTTCAEALDPPVGGRAPRLLP
jgi:hypothetical protein